MITVARAARPRGAAVFAAGLIAGIIAAILVDAFLAIAGQNLIRGWQNVAAAIVGPVASTATSYAVLGVFLHFVTNIVWALIYAYLAMVMWPVLNRVWIISGLVYGLIVMIGMQLVQVAHHMQMHHMHIVQAIHHVLPPGSANAKFIGLELITRLVFFGLPVSWYVSLAAKRAQQAR